MYKRCWLRQYRHTGMPFLLMPLFLFVSCLLQVPLPRVDSASSSRCVSVCLGNTQKKHTATVELMLRVLFQWKKCYITRVVLRQRIGAKMSYPILTHAAGKCKVLFRGAGWNYCMETAKGLCGRIWELIRFYWCNLGNLENLGNSDMFCFVGGNVYGVVCFYQFFTV